MNEILSTFGVDIKLLLAQLINFAIAVGVLWYFAIKPLIKVTKERNSEIEKGLKDAQKSADKLTEVEKDVRMQLNQARAEADKILDDAKKQAENAKKANVEKTKQEVAVLITKAKEQISSEKDNMISEVRNELSDIVVNALHKILGEKVSKDVDKAYVEKLLKEAK